MNSQIVLLLAVLLIAALGAGAYFMTRPKKENFEVLYPSDAKLKRSWDRSAVLTRVLRDGKLP